VGQDRTVKKEKREDDKERRIIKEGLWKEDEERVRRVAEEKGRRRTKIWRRKDVQKKRI
jgi:hypothetical protein